MTINSFFEKFILPFNLRKCREEIIVFILNTSLNNVE